MPQLPLGSESLRSLERQRELDQRNQDYANRERLQVANQLDYQPEIARRVLTLQGQTGLPPEVIQADLENIERDVRVRQFDVDKWRQESPVWASFAAENPYHLAVFKADYENMSTFERAYTQISSRVVAGSRAVAGGVASMLTGLSAVEGFAADQLSVLGQDLVEMRILPVNPFAGMARTAQANTEYFYGLSQRISGEPPPMAGPTERGIYSGLSSFGMNAVTLGAGVALRRPQLALGLMSATAGGLKYNEAIELGHDPNTALLTAVGEGGFEYLFERTPVGWLIGDLAKGTPFFNIVGRQLAVEIPSEQATLLMQDLNDWANLNPDKTLKEFVAERPGAMYETLIATVVGTGLQTGVATGLNRIAERLSPDPTSPSMRFVADSAAASQANRMLEVYQQLGEAAEASKLRTELEPKYREFVDRLRESGGSIYIGVERFREYFQDEAGLDPDQMATTLGVNLEASAELSDLIEIPLDVYAKELAGTEHHKALMADLKRSPDEMSATEAAEFEKEAPALLEELKKQLGVSESDTSAVAKIVNDVTGQLVAAGMEEGAAQKSAQILRGIVTMAERMGLDPVQLYESRFGGVLRDIPEALKRKDVDIYVDPLLDRLRKSEFPKGKDIYGPSLFDFIIKSGGLKDEGGELAARDLGRGRPGLLNNKSGRSLDDLAESAREAGYIQVRDPDAMLEAIDREGRGDQVFSSSRAADKELAAINDSMNELQELLDQQGLDINNLDNAAIKKALASGRTFDQENVTEFRELLGQMMASNVHDPELMAEILRTMPQLASNQDFGDIEIADRVQVQETGEVAVVSRKATVEFTKAVKRRDVVNKLLGCVSG